MKKTAIVTGSTKGIGFAIAEKLIKKDYFVILNYASDDASAASARQALLQHCGGEDFIIIKQALEGEEDIRKFAERCFEIADRFDLVVLNAGCTDRSAWADMSWQSWEHVMNVNINAPAELLRRLDGRLAEDGSVIFISSAMSVWPHAVSVPYIVSKSAVNGLTKALVKEYAERGIRVNAILPGFVDTPWQKTKAADHRKRITDKVALHRFAKPEEIADVVLNVAESGYINGALINVDGGYCYR